MKMVLLHCFIILSTSFALISCETERTIDPSEDPNSHITDTSAEIAEYESFNKLTKEITDIRSRSSCFDRCYAPKMEHRGPACQKFNDIVKSAFSGKSSLAANFENPTVKAAGRTCRRESTKQSVIVKDQCITKCPDAKL
jgi:hypothetical protein